MGRDLGEESLHQWNGVDPPEQRRAGVPLGLLPRQRPTPSLVEERGHLGVRARQTHDCPCVDVALRPRTDDGYRPLSLEMTGEPADVRPHWTPPEGRVSLRA